MLKNEQLLVNQKKSLVEGSPKNKYLKSIVTFYMYWGAICVVLSVVIMI